MSHRLRVLTAFLAAACLMAGCGQVGRIGSQASVTLYGRNAVAADAWFVVRPISDPPESVGFGRDIGVACFKVTPGSEIVMTDRSPSQGGAVIRVIAPVDGPVTLWVDVAADGSVASGDGVPDWWMGDPQVC